MQPKSLPYDHVSSTKHHSGANCILDQTNLTTKPLWKVVNFLKRQYKKNALVRKI